MNNNKRTALRNIHGTITAGADIPVTDVSAPGRIYFIVKRAVDVFVAGVSLVVLLPVFLMIAALIKLDSGGPVFFKHHRIGKNGKDLELLKFRSMVIDAENMIRDFSEEQMDEWERYFKLEDDPRITRVGRFLRRTSLDELPQLVNILMGDLSLVGPRPITEPELERYGENRDKFLSIMPGLTGYWQAYARSDCDFETRMEMELYYVENANLLWDLKIIFATIGAVFCGRGAK